MNIEVGEIIALSDNKEYIVLDTASVEGENYLYLLGNFEPATVRFGILRGTPDNMEIEIVHNQEQKDKILKVFQDKNFNG